MKAAALILALSASPALACDSIVIHLASFHTDRDLIAEVNETNPGLGCRIGAFEFGGYKNSYGDFSAYALGDLTHESGFGAFLGVASGYQDDASVPEHGITPIAGGVYRGDFATIRMGGSYSLETNEPGLVVSLSLSIGGGS